MHPRAKQMSSWDQSSVTKSHNMQSSICQEIAHTVFLGFVASSKGLYKHLIAVASISAPYHPLCSCSESGSSAVLTSSVV